MPFCVKCGEKISEDAKFCAKCGTRFGAVATEEKDYSETGGTLTLIGGILAIVFSTFPLAIMSMWGGMMGGWMSEMGRWGIMNGGWNMPMMFSWIRAFTIIGALVSIVLGIIAILAWQRVRVGRVKSGGTIAIIVGVLMLITMSWVPGLITLVGGILCYTSK